MRWLPFLLLLLCACHRPLPEGSYLLGPDTEVRLGLGEHLRAARRAPDAFSFLEVVEDSRCPLGVQCIQAGRAVVRVAVLRNGRSVTETLTVDGNAVMTDQGELRIEKLEPYPDAGAEESEPYRLLVRLGK